MHPKFRDSYILIAGGRDKLFADRPASQRRQVIVASSTMAD